MITPFAAAKAYAAAQKGMGIGDNLPGISQAPQPGGFGDLVKSAITDAVGASKTAERQIAAQVAGKTELVDVVTAISAAEASLETVMAVRDQVISAYQEIMRMPI
ncbi:flagellar hook-basal body complex protein FliE [uncultured Phenylobacterium sp.]|uniref:flagellar hook-basal body complex protein FliE n=1 Tax=uncultured Phenylobacterium sp. TaxID=349273 RepID=UPI0025CF99DF|nr:flagellar hook-basal body complex protein FliE [uncultured Phenylobacterium sp.]